MKILYIVYLLCVVALGGVAAQGSNYQGRMHVTPLMFEQRGDSLYIRINFDVSGVNVDSQKSISLVPALVSLERRLELPEVQVKGRNNYNVYKRELHLMNGRERARYNQSAPYSVLRGFNAQGAHRVDYSQVIRFEPWMAQAKLDIYEDLSGCGGARRRMGVSMLVNQVLLEKIIEPYSVTAFLAYIQPVAEQVKRREIVSEAFLDFVVNQTNIRPEYLNNPRELRKITELITRVRDDGDVIVRSIKVIGFASPEGTLANNERLCEGRARALVDYLSGRFDYPRSMYKVVFGGENWQGLAEMVENSQMPHRQAVLDIIETVPAQIDYRNDMSRKKALMNLRGGDPYRYMLREFFPYLRKAICKIEFEVRNFDIFRAKEVIRSRPENLSLDEMFMVANSYESGSREFVDVFETAVRVYPDDPTANINAAAAALSRSDLVYAQRYLDRIKSGSVESAEYYNVVGALAMLRGDYDRADMYLSRAASMGLKEARRNLAELAKKRENIKQIEEKKNR